MLDPEHVGPVHTLDTALDKIEYGKQVRALVKGWIESFEAKRVVQGWGDSTPLDELGVMKHLAEVAKDGDCAALKVRMLVYACVCVCVCVCVFSCVYAYTPAC